MPAKLNAYFQTINTQHYHFEFIDVHNTTPNFINGETYVEVMKLHSQEWTE